MDHSTRQATPGDVPALRALIARSARVLGAAYYRAEQVEAALAGAFGVDSQLIDDGTYFVVELGSRIVGCGGWSYRRTLFGSDTGPDRDGAPLDPAVDAAKIRAFFIDPDYARVGLGRALLGHCEAAARAAGFARFALLSTLSGVALYRACGYHDDAPISRVLAPDITIAFVPMHKDAASAPSETAHPR